MRHIWLWCYVTAMTASEKSRGWAADINQYKYSALIRLTRLFSYRFLIFIAKIKQKLGWYRRSLKDRDAVAQANYRNLVNPKGHVDYVGMHHRRVILETASTWGENRDLHAQIRDCAERLSAVVAPVHAKGKPVILAPLHMVSDILEAIVAVKATPRRVTAITSSRADVFRGEDRARGGIDIDYVSIHNATQNLAGDLMSFVQDAIDGKRDLIIYPDITSDFTVHARGRHTPKIPCTLFGRRGQLHEGVIRMSRLMSAPVIFYYLCFDGKKLDIHIEAPLSGRKLKENLPVIIETAIRNRSDDWMLWHAHSLYFIND